jgi:hypothetical protein
VRCASLLVLLLAACGGSSSGAAVDAGSAEDAEPMDGSPAADGGQVLDAQGPADAAPPDAMPADEEPAQVELAWPGSGHWRPRALVRLPGGDYVIVGAASPDDVTYVDGFAARVGSDGTLRWVHRYGGPWEDTFEDVAVLPGGDVIAVGTTQSHGEDPLTSAAEAGYLVRIGAAGQVIWSRHAERPEPATSPRVYRLVAVATTPDGAVIAAGTYGVDVDNGQMVMRVSATGSTEWLATVRFDDVEQVRDLAVLADGTIVLAGMQAALVGSDFRPFATLAAVEPDGDGVRWATRARYGNAGVFRSKVTPALAGGVLWLLRSSLVDGIELDRVAAADGAITAGGRSGRVSAVVDTPSGPVVVGQDYDGDYAPRVAGLDGTLAAERFDHRLEAMAEQFENTGIDVVAEPGGGATALVGRVDGWPRAWLVRTAPDGDLAGCPAQASNTGFVPAESTIPATAATPEHGLVAAPAMVSLSQTAREATPTVTLLCTP